MAAEEIWHYVEARRDDGSPTMFRIRELDPRPELTQIFVVEVPYPATELSRLPDAKAHRRLAQFEEQWLRPACESLGWQWVGVKIEDGSFFLYLYGASDPNAVIERLSPFDAALGFYDDRDPAWREYGTLRELLDQAKALPPEVPHTEPTAREARQRQKTGSDAKAKTKKPKATAAARTTAKARPKAKAKAAAKTKPKARARTKPARAPKPRKRSR
jgi:hypothetical protein